MRVDGKFDDGRIQRLWDGPNRAGLIPRHSDYSIPKAWEEELRAGKPLGHAVSGEETSPDGSSIQYFSNGFIVYYPDGTVTVN